MEKDPEAQEEVAEYVEEAKEAVIQAIEAEQDTKQVKAVQESIEAAVEKASEELKDDYFCANWCAQKKRMNNYSTGSIKKYSMRAMFRAGLGAMFRRSSDR